MYKGDCGLILVILYEEQKSGTPLKTQKQEKGGITILIIKEREVKKNVN